MKSSWVSFIGFSWIIRVKWSNRVRTGLYFSQTLKICFSKNNFKNILHRNIVNFHQCADPLGWNNKIYCEWQMFVKPENFSSRAEYAVLYALIFICATWLYQNYVACSDWLVRLYIRCRHQPQWFIDLWTAPSNVSVYVKYQSALWDYLCIIVILLTVHHCIQADTTRFIPNCVNRTSLVHMNRWTCT